MPSLSRAFKSLRKESLAGLAALGLVIPSAASAAPAAPAQAPQTAPAATAGETVTLLRPAAANCAPINSPILLFMPNMLDTLATMDKLEVSGKALARFAADPKNGFEICAAPGAGLPEGIAYEPTQRRFGFGIYKEEDANAPNNIDRIAANMRTLFSAYQQAQVSPASISSLTAEDAAFAVALANASANAFEIMAMKEHGLAAEGIYEFYKESDPVAKARSDVFDAIFDKVMADSEKSRKPIAERQKEALLVSARTLIVLQVMGRDPSAVAAITPSVQSVIIDMQNNGADRNQAGYAQHRLNVFEQIGGKGLGLDLFALNDEKFMASIPEGMRRVYGIQAIQVPAPAVGAFKPPKR